MIANAIVTGRNESVKGGTSYVGSIKFNISTDSEQYDVTKRIYGGTIEVVSCDKDFVDSFKMDKVYILNIEEKA